MKRSDLRIKDRRLMSNGEWYGFTRTVSDDELRSMAPELLAVLTPEPLTHIAAETDAMLREHGYVRLDGEAKKLVTSVWVDTEDASSKEHAEFLWDDLMDALSELAALEGETE